MTTSALFAGIVVLIIVAALLIVHRHRRARLSISLGAGSQGTRHQDCPGCTCGTPARLGGIPVISDRHVPSGKGYVITGEMATGFFVDLLRDQGWNASKAQVVIHPDDWDRLSSPD